MSRVSSSEVAAKKQSRLQLVLAFGIFNLVSGIALLLASVIAGTMWSMFGPSAVFTVGAVFALLAAFGLLTVGKKKQTG